MPAMVLSPSALAQRALGTASVSLVFGDYWLVFRSIRRCTSAVGSAMVLHASHATHPFRRDIARTQRITLRSSALPHRPGTLAPAIHAVERNLVLERVHRLPEAVVLVGSEQPFLS